jgi:probable rRNA maturation factor
MLTIKNLTHLEINRELLEKISDIFTNREIDITICNNDLIKKYNKRYRDIDKITDVLSFPIDSNFDNTPLGSIVISADFVKERAEYFGHTNQDEFTLLFIHGLLHLLGYDHEIDNGEMRQKEREIIAKFNLPKSLIIRVEENN